MQKQLKKGINQELKPVLQHLSEKSAFPSVMFRHLNTKIKIKHFLSKKNSLEILENLKCLKSLKKHFKLNNINIQAEWAAAHGDNVYKYMFTFKGIYLVYFYINDIPINIGINPKQAWGRGGGVDAPPPSRFLS